MGQQQGCPQGVSKTIALSSIWVKGRRIPPFRKYQKQERDATHQGTGTGGKLCLYSMSSLIHSANTRVHLLRCEAPAEGAKVYKEHTCLGWNYSLGAGAGNKVPMQVLIIKVSTIVFAKCYPCPDLYFHFFASPFFDVPCSMWVTRADNIQETEESERGERKGTQKKKEAKPLPLLPLSSLHSAPVLGKKRTYCH